MKQQLLLKQVLFSELTSCLSSKFILHEVSHKKESQWYSKETATQNFKRGALIFCKVIEIFMILF